MTDATTPQIVPLQQEHMQDVIQLLQSISSFIPSSGSHIEIWTSFFQQDNVHAVVALHCDRVVAYGAIVIEKKIRGGVMGHIEDIVAHEDFRNNGLGKSVINALHDIAHQQGCYKVVLNCKEHNVLFYKKCGYDVGGVSMHHFIK